MSRKFDPNLDDVHVNRDGTIRWDGDAIGVVGKVEGLAPGGARWRAEVGDPSAPEAWPPFRSVYARTRRDAVAGVLALTPVRPAGWSW